MEAVGIICEYNPFHNGHIYHIQKVKELFPHHILILCLNGYFLERGEASLLTKEEKTKLALSYGVDLVLSLPVLFGTQSADTFAEKAIELLYSVGITHLIFGSETNDLSYLTSLAKQQLSDTFSFSNTKNDSFPTRLAKSLNIPTLIPPNDLLGISYIKAILKYHYPIIPVCIQRTSEYHDTFSNDSIVSASNIREKFKNGEDISPFLPYESIKNLSLFPIDTYFLFLKQKILTDPSLEKYLDVKEGLEFKLKKEILSCSHYQEFLSKLKSKRYTYNYLNRMLLHIFLGILKEDASLKFTYLPIVGFNEHGSLYLKEHRKKLLLPIRCDKNSKIFQYELRASILYDLLFQTNTFSFEMKHQPIATLSNDSSQK